MNTFSRLQVLLDFLGVFSQLHIDLDHHSKLLSRATSRRISGELPLNVSWSQPLILASMRGNFPQIISSQEPLVSFVRSPAELGHALKNGRSEVEEFRCLMARAQRQICHSVNHSFAMT